MIPCYKIIFLEAVEEKIAHALEKTLIYNLANYRELKHLGSDLKTNGMVEMYAAKVPFAKIVSVFKGDSFSWLLYGKDIEIFDTGNILDRLLEQDWQDLQNKAKNCFYNPFIALTSRKTLKTFMKSEINQSLFKIDCECKNKDINESLKNKEASKKNLDIKNRVKRNRELLNRALSYEYIQVSLLSMSKITKAICLFSNLKWFLFSFIVCLSIRILLIFDAYFSAKKPFIAYRDSEIKYLNLSYHNTKSFFDFGIYWDILSFEIRFIFWFVLLFAVCAILYRMLYFRLIDKYLSKWVAAYEINSSKFLAYHICGILLIALFLYYVPIYIDKSQLVYGIISLDNVKSIVKFISE